MPDRDDKAFLFASERFQVVSSAFPRRDDLVSCRRRGAVARDCHSFREIALVLSGRAEMLLGDEVFAGGPGTLFLFDGREWHDKGYPPDAPPGRHLWLFPLPDAFSCGIVEVDEGGWRDCGRDLKRDPALMSCLGTAWSQCYENPGEGNRRRLLRTIDLLLTEAGLLLEGAVPEKEEASLQRRAIEAVMQHLNATLGAGDSIPALARLTGFSRAHFLRLFRRFTGCTVGEYVNRLRLSALHRYEKSGLLQKEIADRLGFSSAASLAHWRRRH